MAETPSNQSPTRTPSPNPEINELGANSSQFWCRNCEKRVLIESVADLPDVICEECNNGFVESISAVATDSPPVPSFRSASSEEIDDIFFGNQFLLVGHRIYQDSHEEDALSPPFEHVDQTVDDNLRIELGGWAAADDEDEHSVEVRRDDEYDNRERDNENREQADNDDEENEVIEAGGGGEEQDDTPRSQDLLQLRVSAATRRNRVLDWAEILMGIEDHTVELRFQVPESDTFIGNPGDYVDAAGYEALLQNLVENDNGGRRGAPPASKEAVEGLENIMLIGKEETSLACAICKDSLNVGDIAKKLPCGHEFHGDCIVPWLRSRNSCPICRFELPTDDYEYEEERKKRAAEAGLTVGSSSTSSGGGGGGVNHDPNLN